MIFSREKMIDILEKSASPDLKSPYFGLSTPSPPPEARPIPCPRIILCLSGEKELVYPSPDGIHDKNFHAGEVLLAAPGTWVQERNRKESEMVAILFARRFIRVLYTRNRPPFPKRFGPDFFYHTGTPLSVSGRFLLSALLTRKSSTKESLHTLLALLENITETLKNDWEAVPPNDREWRRIQEAVASNYFADLSREDLANAADLSVKTVSRLVQKHTGMNIRRYFNAVRLENAAELLRNPGTEIKEVASRTGFSYCNYFIRLFKDRYGQTPAEYRDAIQRGRIRE